MASSASATDSATHIQATNNNVSDNNDEESSGRKGQQTWTQFDEVDIDAREYNNKLFYTVEM